MPRRETTITWISLLDLRGEAIGTISKCQQWKATTTDYMLSRWPASKKKFQNAFDQPLYNLPTSSEFKGGGRSSAPDMMVKTLACSKMRPWVAWLKKINIL